MLSFYFLFKLITKTVFFIYKNENIKKLLFQGLGHIALVASPASSRSSSPVSSMFLPYTAEMDDECTNYILRWFYPRDLEWAWETYRSMGRVQRETFLDQSVSSALSEIRPWVPCSVDFFFNMHKDAQLPILDFLRSWAATTDDGLFQDIRSKLLGTRRELDRTNAICALRAKSLRLNYYPYSPHLDHHAERIGPYIAKDLLEDHQSVDAFIKHS